MKEAAILIHFCAKVFLSTEMSSVKSVASSSASSCFDRDISFSPTLIDRERINGDLFAPMTHIFLFKVAENKEDKVTSCHLCSKCAAEFD